MSSDAINITELPCVYESSQIKRTHILVIKKWQNNFKVVKYNTGVRSIPGSYDGCDRCVNLEGQKAGISSLPCPLIFFPYLLKKETEHCSYLMVLYFFQFHIQVEYSLCLEELHRSVSDFEVFRIFSVLAQIAQVGNIYSKNQNLLYFKMQSIMSLLWSLKTFSFQYRFSD